MAELVGRQATQRAALAVPRARVPAVCPGAAQRQRDLQRSLALPRGRARALARLAQCFPGHTHE